MIDILEGENIPISSLKLKRTLDTSVWDVVDGEFTLKQKVREKLTEIASFFYAYLKLEEVYDKPVNMVDAVFTGSLANYNWSRYSDVDLHIVLDLTNIDTVTRKILEAYLKLCKEQFQQQYSIKVEKYDVELYAQSSDTEIVAGGIYSILNNVWIKKPSRENYKIDTTAVKDKTKAFMSDIDEITTSSEFKSNNLHKAKEVWRRIKKMRKTALEEGGEFAVENLVFKMLRRNGYIDKLVSFMSESVDSMLSLKNQ
jgi:predicted nucleotidyltransferase